MGFYIKDEVRDRHIYIPGKTRSGKSTLMFWMALQDILFLRGTCVIDPHGDLVNLLLDHIGKFPAERTVYLDAKIPVPIDFMGYETNEERDLLADDLMVMFNQFFTNTAGDRWQSVLHWTVQTLLVAKGCTFLDIYYFLVDERKRAAILDRVSVPEIRQYWKEQYPHLPKDAALPITTRMSKFLLTPSLKAILGSPNPKLNIYDLMQEQKTLLVNLGGVGKETANLLGTLLVSKIQQAAMRRLKLPREQRKPFYLYADEFQRFQTSAFDDILSEAGKCGLCLTLANQYVGQLDDKIRNAIFGNVATFVLFRLDQKDAAYFKGELTEEETPETPQDKFRDSLEKKRDRLSIEYDIQYKQWGPNPLRSKQLAAELREIENTLAHLPPKQKPAAGPTVAMIPHLAPGQAIYRPADGTATLIHTLKPPKLPKEHYAEIIRKSTVDNYACDTAPDMVDLKEDEPEPSGKPPHGPKEKRP